MRKITVVGIVVAVALGVAFVILLKMADQRSVPSGGDGLREQAIIRMIAAQDPQTIDPQALTDTESSVFSTAVFSPITLVNAEGKVEPILAESVTMSADGRVGRVVLRADCRFSDGSPLRSHDVRFSLARLYANGHPQKFVVERIKGIRKQDVSAGKYAEGFEIVSDKELQIHLDPPDPDFFRLISTAICGIVKEGTDKLEKRPLSSQLVGAGPFKLVDSQQGGIYRFEANPGFPIKIGADGLEIRIVENEQDALTRLAAGQIDLLRIRGNMLKEMFTRKEASANSGEHLQFRPPYSKCKLFSRPAGDLLFVLVNWSHPSLASVPPGRRRACLAQLSSSIDRQQVVDTIYLGTATSAFDAVRLFDGTTPAPPTREADAVTAASIKLDVITGNVGELRQVTELLREQLRQRQIDSDVRLLAVGEFFGRLVKKDFATACLWLESNVSPSPMFWSTFFIPDSAFSLFGASIPEVVPLVEEARSLTDAPARKQRFTEALTMINQRQDCWLPIVSRQSIFAAASWIEDPGIDVCGVPHFALLRANPELRGR